MDTAAARERAEDDLAAIVEADGRHARGWRVRLKDRCGAVLALADEVDRLQATLTALDNAAACYRANLRDILGECSHDRPRIDKIRGYAERAIRGADYWLKKGEEA